MVTLIGERLLRKAEIDTRLLIQIVGKPIPVEGMISVTSTSNPGKSLYFKMTGKGKEGVCVQY